MPKDRETKARHQPRSPGSGNRRPLGFLDASFEGIAITEDGIILHANERVGEMFQYRSEELVGRPVAELVAPEDRARVEGLIREGHLEAYTHKGLRKDGTTFPLEALGRPVQWEGRTVRISAVRDVTEKERSTARIRESEERLRFLFDAAPDAYLVHMPDGRIVEANRAAELLLGRKKGELEKSNLRELGLSPKSILEDILGSAGDPQVSDSQGPHEMLFLR